MRITAPTIGTGSDGDGYRPDLPESIGWTNPEYSADYTTVTVTLPDTPEVEQWAVEQRYIVTTPRIAQRKATQLAVADKIIGDQLDDQTVAELSALFDPWKNEPGTNYTAGELRHWDDTVIECIQTHTHNDPNHTPNLTPALWKIHRTTSGANPDRWVQPTGGHDAYAQDENWGGAGPVKVTHDRPQDDGEDWVFESKIPANTTEPGRDGTFDRWWHPVSRASEYQP